MNPRAEARIMAAGRRSTWLLALITAGAVVLFGGLLVPPTRAADESRMGPVPGVAGDKSRLSAPHGLPVTLPLAFEPNRGQVDRRVRFLVHAGGTTLFLTRTAIVLDLVQHG